MPTIIQTELIQEQIRKSHHEVLLQNFVFALTNTLSLLLIGLIFYRLVRFGYNEKEDYSKFLQASLALVVPFLTFIGQGFSYPRRRRIEILEHLLGKVDLTSDDVKCIYEK